MATSTSYNNWVTADTGVGLKVTNSAPLDRRFVVDELANIFSLIPKAYRYPGLRVYAMKEEKEYWFKSGVEKANLVEYHPESMYVVEESNFDPEAAPERLARGSEITVFDSEGNPTKYVWNGTSWRVLGGASGSATITPIITNVATDTYEELEALINSHVQANDITVTAGTEIPVIFVDTAEEDKNADVYNKYVYLGTGDGETAHWYQASGTEVFRFSVPSAILEAEVGTEMLAGASNTAGKYIKFVKGADRRLDVVISHNFCSQFVDASFYRADGGEAEDKDFDQVLDSDWGEEVFLLSDLVKSDGEYKLVITFTAYDAEEDGDAEFVVVLQR